MTKEEFCKKWLRGFFLTQRWEEAKKEMMQDLDQVVDRPIMPKHCKHHKIEELEQKLADDGEGEKPNLGSINCFLALSKLMDVDEMCLSLTSENNIYGAWAIEDLRFGVHFKPDNTVKIVIIKTGGKS